MYEKQNFPSESPKPAYLAASQLYQQSLDHYNQITDTSWLTHQNVDYLLKVAFTKCGISLEEYERLHNAAAISIAVIGNGTEINELRDAILKFIGQEPIHNQVLIAVCKGFLNRQTGQIEGESHWTALHLRRSVNRESVFIESYYMDSLGGSIPSIIRDILASINRTHLSDLGKDLSENETYKRALDRLSTLKFQSCEVLPCQRQTDHYSCGYHTVFNLIRLHYSRNPLDLSLQPPTIIQDSRYLEIRPFIEARKSDLKQHFNFRGLPSSNASASVQRNQTVFESSITTSSTLDLKNEKKSDLKSEYLSNCTPSFSKPKSETTKQHSFSSTTLSSSKKFSHLFQDEYQQRSTLRSIVFEDHFIPIQGVYFTIDESTEEDDRARLKKVLEEQMQLEKKKMGDQQEQEEAKSKYDAWSKLLLEQNGGEGVKQPVQIDEIFSAHSKLSVKIKQEHNIDLSILEKPIHRVLIIGQAGSGKTTLSKHLAYQWSRGALWKDQYDQVFWLTFRDLHNIGKLSSFDSVNLDETQLLAHIIYYFCLEETNRKKITIENITQYLTHKPERTLLLLDGYDEVAKAFIADEYPQLRSFLRATFRAKTDLILTSRGYSLPPTAEIIFDRRLVNRGFTDQQVKNYIQDYFYTFPLIVLNEVLIRSELKEKEEQNLGITVCEKKPQNNEMQIGGWHLYVDDDVLQYCFKISSKENSTRVVKLLDTRVDAKLLNTQLGKILLGIKNKCLSDKRTLDTSEDFTIFKIVQVREKLSDQVLNFVQQNLRLWSYVHNPLILALVCDFYRSAYEGFKIIQDLTLLDLYRDTFQQFVRQYLDKMYHEQYPLEKTREFSLQDLQNICSSEIDFLKILAFKGVEKGTQRFDKSIKQEALSEVKKWHSMQKDSIFVSSLQMGFLHEFPGNEASALDKVHEFVHLTFQEYLAARYVADGLQRNARSSYEWLRKYKYHPSYREILSFICNLMDPEKYKTFWEILLAEQNDMGGMGHLHLTMYSLEATRCHSSIPRRTSHLERVSQAILGILKAKRFEGDTWRSLVQHCPSVLKALTDKFWSQLTHLCSESKDQVLKGQLRLFLSMLVEQIIQFSENGKDSKILDLLVQYIGLGELVNQFPEEESKTNSLVTALLVAAENNKYEIRVEAVRAICILITKRTLLDKQYKKLFNALVSVCKEIKKDDFYKIDEALSYFSKHTDELSVTDRVQLFSILLNLSEKEVEILKFLKFFLEKINLHGLLSIDGCLIKSQKEYCKYCQIFKTIEVLTCRSLLYFLQKNMPFA